MASENVISVTSKRESVAFLLDMIERERERETETERERQRQTERDREGGKKSDNKRMGKSKSEKKKVGRASHIGLFDKLRREGINLGKKDEQTTSLSATTVYS